MSDETPYQPKIDRRTALAWVGAVAAAGAVTAGVVVYERGPHGKPKTAKNGVPGGYGTDPKLNPPEKAPWPRLLAKEELQTAAVLCDFILPASGTAPSASSLGVPDFIDEWVSAPYPDQLKDLPIISNGLKALGPKLKADRAAALAALPTATDDATKTFFKKFRGLTIGAYYTTEAGFKDIGYIGNQARPSDPGPSAEARAAVTAALKKLGLPA